MKLEVIVLSIFFNCLIHLFLLSVTVPYIVTNKLAFLFFLRGFASLYSVLIIGFPSFATLAYMVVPCIIYRSIDSSGIGDTLGKLLASTLTGFKYTSIFYFQVSEF